MDEVELARQQKSNELPGCIMACHTWNWNCQCNISERKNRTKNEKNRLKYEKTWKKKIKFNTMDHIVAMITANVFISVYVSWHSNHFFVTLSIIECAMHMKWFNLCLRHSFQTFFSFVFFISVSYESTYRSSIIVRATFVANDHHLLQSIDRLACVSTTKSVKKIFY